MFPTRFCGLSMFSAAWGRCWHRNEHTNPPPPPPPRFEKFPAFNNPFSISLASFVKMTWVLNVQRKFYEPTLSAHPWIGSRPGFVGFRCFQPRGGAASTKTSTPTPRFETFPAFSNPFSISLASFVKMTWVLNVQCKFYEPTPQPTPNRILP